MTVIDAFAAASDRELPTVALALDPGEVSAEFKRGLPRLAGEQGKVKVKSITVTRHKPAVWNAGFHAHSSDGISVPEPIGVIPRFKMWLQRKIIGAEATTELLRRDGALLARRLAEAIHKLHTAEVPAKRSHTMADELRILHEHLPQVAEVKPELNRRIARLLRACDRLEKYPRHRTRRCCR